MNEVFIIYLIIGAAFACHVFYVTITDMYDKEEDQTVFFVALFLFMGAVIAIWPAHFYSMLTKKDTNNGR